MAGSGLWWERPDLHYRDGRLLFGGRELAALAAEGTPAYVYRAGRVRENLARYVEAGCSRVIIHAESVTHLHRSLGQVRELGAAAGVALNPATPTSAVAHVLDLVDLVLVMTVNPGFGGQERRHERHHHYSAIGRKQLQDLIGNAARVRVQGIDVRVREDDRSAAGRDRVLHGCR